MPEIDLAENTIEKLEKIQSTIGTDNIQETVEKLVDKR